MTGSHERVLKTSIKVVPNLQISISFQGFSRLCIKSLICNMHNSVSQRREEFVSSKNLNGPHCLH